MRKFSFAIHDKSKRSKLWMAASAVAILAAASGVLSVTSFQTEAKETVSKEVSAAEKIFNAETYTLDNGLQIVVLPNDRAPVVTQMVWYKVGAADEQPGKSGIAHFLEHLMFKGSKGLQPGEFSKKIRAQGGEDNAFTGHDYTSFHQSVPVSQLEMVMTMEAGRMRGLNPPLGEVESERKVIVEERRQRTDNDPRARFAEQLNALLFVNHPYSKPIIGWKNEMEGLSWDDAKSFYDLWYAPNNAILIVAGDVTGPDVLELAKKIYGPIPRSDHVPKRERTISPPLSGSPEVTLEDPNIHEPTVQIISRVPSARENKQDALALQVLEEIMDGGPASRFYKSLVVEQKIATSAGMSYDSDTWDDADLWLYATPVPGQDLKALKKALEDQMRKVIADGVTDAEMKEALTRMQTDVIYARDSLEGPALIFGHALTTGSTIDDVEYWTRDISQVTAQQVQDVARKYLNPDAPTSHPPVVGYMIPEVKSEGQPSAAQPEPPTGDVR